MRSPRGPSALAAMLAALLLPAAALGAQRPSEREAERAAERAVPLPPAPQGLESSQGGEAAESSTVSRGGGLKPFVPGEVIVRFETASDRAERAELLRAERLTVAEKLPLPGALLLELPAGIGPRRAADELEQRPSVLYAQPNYLRQAQVLPNDPRLNQLWGLHNTGQAVNGQPSGTPDADIDAPEAWNLSKGRTAIKVAVVDSGVAYDHPALQGNIWANPGESVNGVDDDANGFVDDSRGWDFVDDDRDPADEDSHGTHVAGTIGARGNDGHSIVGVNWQVGLMPLRVLGPQGGSDADIASAFVYAAREGARVVNASLGGPGQTPLIANAVNNNPRVLYVVAAGNGGSDGIGDNNDSSPTYPCNIPAANLICVAATDQNDQLTDFSNYGQANVDLAAPGFNILSAIPAFRTPHFSDFQDDSYSNFEPNGWTVSQGSTWSGYDDWTADFGVGFSVTDSAGLCWPSLGYEDGCYKANFDHTAYSPQFSLAGMHHCTLSYWLYVDIAATNFSTGDFLQVGALSSSKPSGTAIHNWNGGPGSPQVNPWTDDLSAFEGHSGVRIYLGMNSDGTYDKRDGAHVDDVTVNCLSKNYGPGDFKYFPGTSMASPHVAGAAALILARVPGLSVAQLRQLLLATVDKKTNLAGVTATGGRLNVNRGVRVADSATKLKVSDVSLIEGDSGTRYAKFTVSRTWAAGAVSVKYATANGTAKAPSDYKSRAGTIGLTASQTAKQVSVPVVGDKKKEKHEKFYVKLSSPKGTTIGDGLGVGVVRNDD